MTSSSAWRISLTVASSAASSMSARTTFMPSRPKRSAIARPIPLAPPVTTATLPSRSRILSFLACGAGGHGRDGCDLGGAELAARRGRRDGLEAARALAQRGVRRRLFTATRHQDVHRLDDDEEDDDRDGDEVDQLVNEVAVLEHAAVDLKGQF